MGSEERMLRGQENEILKKAVNDACESLDTKLADHEGKMEKLLDEERDERALQHDDMITRLDRERKDRIKGNDNLQNQLHDEVEAMATRHIRDTEDLKDAVEKEAELRQSLRNDLEKELIEQGKELFNEIDKNKHDIDDRLAKEMDKMNEENKHLQSTIKDNFNILAEKQEDSTSNLLRKLENENQALHEKFDNETVGLAFKIDSLADKVEKDNSDIRKDLEQERIKRHQDKEETYKDFEQICRNIDGRITGEKEKLWDQIKDDQENLENFKVRSMEDNA